MILVLILEYTIQGQKAAVRPVTEGELQPCQTVFRNIQVPQSLKHPKKELDQLRLPLESKGKFLELVWGAICIPACPYANFSVPPHSKAKGDEQTLG